MNSNNEVRKTSLEQSKYAWNKNSKEANPKKLETPYIINITGNKNQKNEKKKEILENIKKKSMVKGKNSNELLE